MNEVKSFDDEHEAFAASRVTQYVYVPQAALSKDAQTSKDLQSGVAHFTALDQHADTVEGDIKPPLVIVGNEGSGKSALLANWVAKRREHRHRDEFLLQHFVGCTTPSLQLAHTLFRLETALKDFFQLREMKVPDTEEDLRWSLNRFLAAAAKKHFPARIIIIIDGVHRLKADGAPDGALHWLPTELPPCVRLIVSTVEYERNTRNTHTQTQHRTFVELMRRQCPLIKIEPLVASTKYSIIRDFAKLGHNTGNACDFTEAQCFKMQTTVATAQPMYLRALLQSMKLAASLTNLAADSLMEMFLSCPTAYELIDKNLEICCRAIFPGMGEDEESTARSEMLGKILAMVYVSRNGLTMNEIWGLITMVMRTQPDETETRKMYSVLRDFTMVVSDMHSFSHEVYREVVYSKYICSHDALIRWHHLLARFFSQLPPGGRKLVALPYHLAEAGSWSKVKNCLTEIEMFRLWWKTPEYKPDFIKFWASLTRQDNKKDSHSSHGKKDKRSGGGGGHSSSVADTEHSSTSKQRPYYDIVEEYTKSLDEFRYHKKPTDEALANIILEIGDFLLEFAILGHEEQADVPSNVHPLIPNEDLRNIGVPYIETDELGLCCLVFPEIFPSFGNNQKGDDVVAGMGGGGGAVASDERDVTTKAPDDMPLCTTYYFQRWMWIQFPYIALGNCNAERYEAGINKKLQDSVDGTSKSRRSLEMDGMRQTMSAGSGRGKSPQASMSRSWGVDAFKLPEIKFARKAARSVSRIVQTELDPSATNDKVAVRLMTLQDDIQNYREEYDFVVQVKGTLLKRLAELKGSLEEQKRSVKSIECFEDDLDVATRREKESYARLDGLVTGHHNLKNLVAMCDRHPANVPALLEDLHSKIRLDNFLLAEIKKRLWEQRFEKQTHVSSFRQMKKLVQDGADMHNKLLEHRYKMRQHLTQQAVEDEARLKVSAETRAGTRNKTGLKAMRVKNGKDNKEGESERSLQIQEHSWEEIWSVISMRTGISEPDIFFARLSNRNILEEQINSLKKGSEGRLETLKKEVTVVERDLETSRYEAAFPGGQSSKETHKKFTDQQFALRHAKERAESSEQLQQRVIAGLVHIGEMLGIPPREEDSSVIDLFRDIEAVQETLMDEREKQLQQQGQLQSHSSADGPSRSLVNRDAMLSPNAETYHRTPELDFVLARYEVPTARLPSKIPSRPRDPVVDVTARESDDGDDEDDEGMWDRRFAKGQSTKNLRVQMKKVARQNKLETAMAGTI